MKSVQRGVMCVCGRTADTQFFQFAYKAAEWKGKRIYPFFTSGGQPGKTANDFKRLLEDKGALVGGSLSVPYKRNLPQRPVDEIIRWAEENKFEE